MNDQSPLEHLRLYLGEATRQIESMVRDHNAIQHELGRALPSVRELSQAERVKAASALLGFDADLQQRLCETALKFGALLENLDGDTAFRGWLRRRLDELM
jgi:hypothetical protein